MLQSLVIRLASVMLGAFALSSMPAGSLAGVVRPAQAPVVHQQSHATILRRGTSSGDWPQLGYDSGHSAYNPNETTIGVSNVAQLQQAWSFPTGAGNNAGNVVEAGGVVYAPTANGTLYAINASTGQQAWSFASGAGYTSSGSAPVYDGGLVFTVCNTSGSTQGICALHASDGIAAWTYTFPGSAAYDGTPPVVGYGDVFFEACASSCSYVALDEQTGGVKWAVAEPQGSCEGNGGVTPAVAYKLLYVDFTCEQTEGELAALHVKNGTTKWSQDQAQTNVGLSVGDGILAVVYQLFSPAKQHLDAYSAKKGDGKWAAQGGPWSGSGVTMPAITKNLVYLVVGGYFGSHTTGRGRIGPSSYPHGGLSSWPSVANGVLYAACAGTPCAFDASTGNFLGGPTPSGVPTYGVPIVANGVLYAACNGDNVCAWALPGSMRRRS